MYHYVSHLVHASSTRQARVKHASKIPNIIIVLTKLLLREYTSALQPELLNQSQQAVIFMLPG